MTKKNVCIVGGGATGVALLWALSQDPAARSEWNVTLIHDQPAPSANGIGGVGGHSLTYYVPVPGKNKTLPIDIGVQFISPMMYPSVHVMLQRPEFQSRVPMNDYDALKVAAAFPRLDFVIHSIAFAERDLLQVGKFITTPRAQYLSAIDVSAYTLLAFARAAHPQMKKTGGGAILGMSYYGAEKVVPGYNIMGVAKACLECTARYLASEMGQDGVRVIAVASITSRQIGPTPSTPETSCIADASALPTHTPTAKSDV